MAALEEKLPPTTSQPITSYGYLNASDFNSEIAAIEENLGAMNNRLSARSNSQPNTGAESKTDAGAESKTDTGAESKTDTGAESKTDTGAESKTDTGAIDKRKRKPNKVGPIDQNRNSGKSNTKTTKENSEEEDKTDQSKNFAQSFLMLGK